MGLLPGSNNDLLAVGVDLDQALGTDREKGVADFHDCVVLYDPQGLYRIVKSRLADYPVQAGTRVLQAKLEQVIRVALTDIPRAARSGNDPWLLHARAGAQQALLRAVFVINRDYFPRVKDAEWLLASMPHLPQGLPDGVRQHAREPDPAAARRLLLELARGVLALAERIWPEELSADLKAGLAS